MGANLGGLKRNSGKTTALITNEILRNIQDSFTLTYSRSCIHTAKVLPWSWIAILACTIQRAGIINKGSGKEGGVVRKGEWQGRGSGKERGSSKERGEGKRGERRMTHYQSYTESKDIVEQRRAKAWCHAHPRFSCPSNGSISHPIAHGVTDSKYGQTKNS